MLPPMPSPTLAEASLDQLQVRQPDRSSQPIWQLPSRRPTLRPPNNKSGLEQHSSASPPSLLPVSRATAGTLAPAQADLELNFNSKTLQATDNDQGGLPQAPKVHVLPLPPQASN